ncbi:NAD-dependent epimerase/dehydratase family protein [Pelagibacterium lentulum]|uniref:Short-chain dehydrogenase n=1 Tax=Pelagibacterium lentulum TaxID=2029865 RepID=A0A916VZZ6_9HYPH|nr:NAD(P)-dependent oxidoreductase [Pelagibacterium lentulum]GGA55208.1 short-chain dehydrogenase [Pelagibacterium lentulum]
MSERPSIAITGAGGFVGSHLAEGLARLGHRVVATDRHFSTATRARLQTCRIVEGPLTTSLAREVVSGCDVLVHGAALTTAPQDLGLSDTAHLKHNLDMLLDAIDAAERASVGQIVFLSSSGVFAPGDGDQTTTETTPDTAGEPYALAKRIGEIVTQAHHGLSLRLGPIYGPNETVRRSRTSLSLVCRLIAAAQARQSLVLETPARRRDWTYAPDLARALAQLVCSPHTVRGVLHCGSGQIVSDLELAHMIAGPGAATAIGVPTTPEPTKAPMVSIRHELAGFAWTSLEAGLAALGTQSFAEGAR